MPVPPKNRRRRNPAIQQKKTGPQMAPKRSSAPRKGLVLYIIRHIQACLQSLGQFMRHPLAGLMTLVVIGIALALPTGLFVLLDNVQNVSDGWTETTQVSLYLKMDVSQNQAEDLMNQLRNQPDIAAVHYISPAQGLKQFEKNADFGKMLGDLPSNPLPGVILVMPAVNVATPEAVTNLVNTLQRLPEVDTAKLDMEWVKRLFALINFGKRLVYALACLFGLGVLLIIGNTIHLTTQRHKQEIEIYKLVGATDGFVRRPFLYTGILYGLLGAIIAWFFVSGLLWLLQAPSTRLASLYNSNFHVQGLSGSGIITLLIVGVLLGLGGSWMAVRKHLRSIEGTY